MRHPVAATRSTGSVASCTTGKQKIPTRAPSAKERVTSVTRTQPAAQIAAASGASTSAAPTNVMTDLPPRKRAKSGSACPSMAAAAAA